MLRLTDAKKKSQSRLKRHQLSSQTDALTDEKSRVWIAANPLTVALSRQNLANS